MYIYETNAYEKISVSMHAYIASIKVVLMHCQFDNLNIISTNKTDFEFCISMKHEYRKSI